ncbi:hypothetical protein C8J57DRAFT_1536260 [Mycena rebaudengoi]|nr:hypothetical protein C8J57DRAFT_1536260 [Mycena rebaudengoi]
MTGGTSQNAAEVSSAVGTEFLSANDQSRLGPMTAIPTTDATSPPTSSAPMRPRFTLCLDELGAPFLVNAAGIRQELSVDTPRSASSLSGGPTGIPMHPSNLFGGHQDGETASLIESTLSESQHIAADGLPELALDLNPDDLSPHQLGQLNAIRGVIRTASARLLATTAIVAEQQTATEDMHDTLQSMRHEFVSRIDSMRDEVNSQRSRLNRCLDDNLRIVRETGASAVQIGEVLSIMTWNGGVHRRPREAESIVEAGTIPIRKIPDGIRAAADAVIAPHQPAESVDAFNKRAQAVLRTKDRAHVAFADGHPSTPRMRQVNAVMTRGLHPIGDEDIRFNNESASTARRSVPPGIHNNPSGYHSMTGNVLRDVAADFAAEMENVIRTTIEHRVGHRVDLPPGVHTPKVGDPLWYRGADDHDAFMMFLERLLGWMKANNCGGADLDTYRITLLQNYLDEEALKWFVHKVDNPRKNGGISPEFADVSSTAQRATRTFEDVKWKADEGPEGLYTDLTQTGDRMIEPPSQFTLRDRFMKALPSWIKTELKMRRGMTAEFGDLETLRTHARQVWEIELSIRAEREAEQAAQGGTRPSPRVQGLRGRPGEAPSRDNWAKEEARPWDNRAREAEGPRQPANNEKSCYSCGNKGHYTRDKECPNYSERAPPRARVAAQRVLESYSDEEDEYAEYDRDYDYQDPTEHSDKGNEDLDPNAAPDLADLVATTDEPRLNTMRGYRTHYYSMRVMNKSEPATEMDETETSVTDSSEEAPHSPIPPFGTYNPGPICVICEGCALVIWQLMATTENRLEVNREYAVCEHLAHVGIDPERVDIPPSPIESVTALISDDLSTRITDWEDELDLSPGVLIPIDQRFTEETPEAEVQMRDRQRVSAGLSAFTALEYDINVRWVRQFMPALTERDEERVNRHEQETLMNLRNDPEEGRRFRGIAALQDEEEAREMLERLGARGPDAPFVIEPVLRDLAINRAHALSLEIAYRKGQAVTLRRHSRASIVRINDISRAWDDEDEMDPDERESWHKAKELNSENRFRLGLDLEWLRMETNRLVRAQTAVFEQTADLANAAVKVSGHGMAGAPRITVPTYGVPSRSPASIIRLAMIRPLNAATEMALGVPAGSEAAVDDEDAQYWERMSPVTAAQVEAADPPTSDHESDTESTSTAEDYNSHLGLGGYTWEEEADRAHHIESTGRPANGSYLDEDYLERWPQLFTAHANTESSTPLGDVAIRRGDNLLVPESYDSLAEMPAPAPPSDELILRSVIMTGQKSAERCDTLVDGNN